MTTDVLLERPHGSKASRSVRGFWVGSVTVLGLLLVAGDSRYWNDYFAFALVFLSAVFPAFLWMSGRAAGLPLFPVFAASTILPFAFPLISQSAPLGRFDSGERILAAVKIATALALGSWVWYAMLRRLRKNNPQVRVIDERRADRLFIGAIAMSAFFATAINGGWLQPYWGATTIVRGILLALNSIGSFVIGFRWGTRALERTYRLVFVIAFLFYLLATISSLLLIGAMTACALFVTGFSIGRRRIPWRWIAAGLVVFGVLHIGKTRMRDRYWFGREDAAAVAPWDYGSFFREWVLESVEGGDVGTDSQQTILDRAGLLHLFLLVQRDSPETIPFMDGETYQILPQLLIPRIFSPEKIASHEGTYLLNIHYGLQRREDTLSTTIAWGLVNEANANFGFPGVVTLFIVLGLAYGAISRWARDTPILSFPSLAALVILSVAVQAEFTAGIYFTTLLQSLVALLLVRIVFMRRKAVPVVLMSSDAGPRG